MRIAQVAVAAFASGETEIRMTACVDERGAAWELRGQRWVPLPALPECTCQQVAPASSHKEKCPYRAALAGGRP